MSLNKLLVHENLIGLLIFLPLLVVTVVSGTVSTLVASGMSSGTGDVFFLPGLGRSTVAGLGWFGLRPKALLLAFSASGGR